MPVQTGRGITYKAVSSNIIPAPKIHQQDKPKQHVKQFAEGCEQRNARANRSRDHIQGREQQHYPCSIEKRAGQIRRIARSWPMAGGLFSVLPYHIGSIEARKRHNEDGKTQKVGTSEDSCSVALRSVLDSI